MGNWSSAELDGWRAIGDPLADDVVASLFESNEVGKANALLHDLILKAPPKRKDLPQVLRDYLDAVVLPEWADPARIAASQRLFQTFGLPISVCLFCASLPSSYAAKKGVQVLHLTARLETDTKRRVMETGQFLMDVMAPGGLGPEGKGIHTIGRVRLMHAAIRYLIGERAKEHPEDWDPEWGLPINQEDLAATLLAFSYVVGEPLPRLGIDVERDDADAYLHTWNVIGHLLGVREELMVADLPEATRLVTIIRKRQLGPTDEGKEMTAALLQMLDHMNELDLLDGAIPALIRHLIGDQTAEWLGIAKAKPLADLFVRLTTRIVGHADGVVDDSKLLRRVAEPLGRAMLHAVFELQRGGERAPFAIPQTLRDSWKLDA